MISQEMPKTEDSLKNLRTEDVLSELDRKFGRGNGNLDGNLQHGTRTDAVLDELDSQARRREKSLEGIPFHSDTIPAEEMRKIIEASEVCRQFIQGTENQIAELAASFGGDSAQFEEEKNALLKKQLADLEASLDRLPFWNRKFSTDNTNNGALAEAPIAENPERDSIYYITPSSVSLRLKKVNLINGLNAVVNKFAEKIFFVRKREISLEPKLGYTVEEYFGEDFSNIIISGQVSFDFQSAIKTFQSSDGKIRDVIPTNGKTEKHDGDRVNKIF